MALGLETQPRDGVVRGCARAVRRSRPALMVALSSTSAALGSFLVTAALALLWSAVPLLDADGIGVSCAVAAWGCAWVAVCAVVGVPAVWTCAAPELVAAAVAAVYAAVPAGTGGGVRDALRGVGVAALVVAAAETALLLRRHALVFASRAEARLASSARVVGDAARHHAGGLATPDCAARVHAAGMALARALGACVVAVELADAGVAAAVAGGGGAGNGADPARRMVRVGLWLAAASFALGWLLQLVLWNRLALPVVLLCEAVERLGCDAEARGVSRRRSSRALSAEEMAAACSSTVAERLLADGAFSLAAELPTLLCARGPCTRGPCARGPCARGPRVAPSAALDGAAGGAPAPVAQLHEADALRKAISRLWRLVQLGFGEAGHSIVSRFIGVEGEVRAQSRGSKIHAIFCFVDVRSFTTLTECFQEDVLAFVNDIASIVHTQVHVAGGAPNTSAGDAWLVAYKLPTKPLDNVVRSPSMPSPPPAAAKSAPHHRTGGSSSVTLDNALLYDAAAAAHQQLVHLQRLHSSEAVGCRRLSICSGATGLSDDVTSSEQAGIKSRADSSDETALSEALEGLGDPHRGGVGGPSGGRGGELSGGRESAEPSGVAPSSRLLEDDAAEAASLQWGEATRVSPSSSAPIVLGARAKTIARLRSDLNVELKKSAGLEVAAQHVAVDNALVVSAGFGPRPVVPPLLVARTGSGVASTPLAVRAFAAGHPLAVEVPPSSTRRGTLEHRRDFRQLRGITVFANNALAACVNILVHTGAANLAGGVLHKFLRNPALRASQLWTESGGRYRIRVGCGLHLGWAVEGAIGTSLKVDASYLSPAVNVTARLESATKLYGVDVLVSRAFAQCLSFEAVSLLRRVDRVKLQGVSEPLELFTFDWHGPSSLELLSEGHGDRTAAFGTRVAHWEQRADSRYDSNVMHDVEEGDAPRSPRLEDSLDSPESAYALPRSAHSRSHPALGGHAHHRKGQGIRYLAPLRNESEVRQMAFAEGGRPSDRAGGGVSHEGTGGSRSVSAADNVGSRRSAAEGGGGLYGSPEEQIADLVYLQPPDVFSPEWVDLADAAVNCYLGEYLPDGAPLVAADWGLARAFATKALALRPTDGPLQVLMRTLSELAVVDPATGRMSAPPSWQGWRHLEK